MVGNDVQKRRCTDTSELDNRVGCFLAKLFVFVILVDVDVGVGVGVVAGSTSF